jgi:hypothetical protein
MQRILLAPLCLGILSTSGCYVDPAGVSTSVGVGVGAYTYDPSWVYYPHRDGWYDDRHSRRGEHRWDRWPIGLTRNITLSDSGERGAEWCSLRSRKVTS